MNVEILRKKLCWNGYVIIPGCTVLYTYILHIPCWCKFMFCVSAFFLQNFYAMNYIICTKYM
jgi:hypothetical protein